MMFTGKAKSGNGDLPDGAEDVSDIIGIISPHETPLLNHLGDAKQAATGILHSWQDGPLESTNHVQSFIARLEVSRSGQASRAYGVADEVDYQKQERMRELLRDLENCVINGVAPSGDGMRMQGQAMAGLVSMINTNRIRVDGGLNGDLLNDSIGQVNAEVGSHVDTIVVGGAQKRRLNAFNDGHIIYKSDHCLSRIVLSRWMPPDSVLLLDSSRVSVIPMQSQSFHYQRLAATNNSISGQLVGMYTLEFKDEGAHGIITGLDV